MKLWPVTFVVAFSMCWPLAASSLARNTSSQAPTHDVLELKPNHSLERTLQGGEAHAYKITLGGGQYFHVDVAQQGIDVILVLLRAGEEIIERDRPNGKNGGESLSFIAPTGGSYLLVVKALDKQAAAGRYEIKSEAPRSPTSRDQQRAAAEQLFQEGLQLQLGPDKTAETAKRAGEKYERAAGLYQALGDGYAEALVQTGLSLARERLGETEKAVAGNDRALFLFRELKDQTGEAATLGDLCVLNAQLARLDLALAQYRQAKTIYQALKDREAELALQERLGAVADANRDTGFRLFRQGGATAFAGAREKFAVARAIYEELEDKAKEAHVLVALGRVTGDFGDKRKALAYYTQALPLLRAVKDKGEEALTLNNIGSVYDDLDDGQKALDYYQQALSVHREEGDKSGEAMTLNNIGNVYSVTGEKQKAIAYFEQALTLSRATGDRVGQSTTLSNIGKAYTDLGEKQKGLSYYEQALVLAKTSGERDIEGVILNNIGAVYSDLGEQQKALDFYNQALPLRRSTGDKSGEATTLNNIGLVHYELGEKQKALDYYNQALPLRRELGDKSGEASTLNNLGLVYQSLGEGRKALGYFNDALPLSRSAGDKSLEATTLNNLGGVSDDLGDKQKALAFYSEALPLYRSIGELEGEATTLNNLMVLCYDLRNPRLAIFYGKQSVNLRQQLRANIKGLDKELQKTFAHSIEHTYRSLAKILIEAGRLPEAQGVLDLLKEEEFSALAKRRGATGEAFPYNPEEARAVETLNRLAEIGREHGDLLEKGKRGSLDDAGKQRLKQLSGDLRLANEEYQKALNSFAAIAQNSSGYEVVSKEAEALKADLRELGGGTVALYTVIVKDASEKTTNGWIILVAPSFQKAYPIDVTNLEQTVFAFRAAVSNPLRDPLPLAHRLYQMLFQQTSDKREPTLAQDLDTYLKGQPNKTLMWSLDGVLRYVPMAALHDGRQYLVERFRNVVFNTASKARLKDSVSPKWTALGLGVSEQREEAGLTFIALTGAEEELRRIIKVKDSPSGILPGVVRENKEFTRDAMLDGLLFNNYPVVHISSHFSFHPADFEQSFLLLGQGRWTVAEMRKETTLFTQVDLVTLSACETAMGNANGKDAEGFAYLAQSLGAKAVIASLWPVDDAGTQALMPEFYRLHETGLSKAEALQRAQIALLSGLLKFSAGQMQTQRSTQPVATVGGKPDAGLFKVDPQRPFAHPFYWAPFVLIGNWK